MKVVDNLRKFRSLFLFAPFEILFFSIADLSSRLEGYKEAREAKEGDSESV